MDRIQQQHYLGKQGDNYTLTKSNSSGNSQTKDVKLENLFGGNPTICIKNGNQPVVRPQADGETVTSRDMGLFAKPDVIDCTKTAVDDYFASNNNAELLQIEPGDRLYNMTGKSHASVKEWQDNNNISNQALGNLQPGNLLIIPTPESQTKPTGFLTRLFNN